MLLKIWKVSSLEWRHIGGYGVSHHRQLDGSTDCLTNNEENSTLPITTDPLQWRHNERDGVSNHQHLDCLLNRLFGRGPKETIKLRWPVNSPHKGPVTQKMFPFDDVIMPAMGKSLSMSWHHMFESGHNQWSNVYDWLLFVVVFCIILYIEEIGESLLIRPLIL